MSLRIDLDTSDYDVTMNLFRSNIPTFPPKAVRGATDIVEKNMIDVVPVKTGELKNSITKRVVGPTGIVETNSGYGKFVDEDTEPHKITGNPLLAFHWRGKLTIRHSVNHPGTKGQQFRRKTLTNSQFQIISEIIRVYNDEVIS